MATHWLNQKLKLPMIQIIQTDSTNSDFQMLVKLLDEDLAIRDGEEHAFYAQFNKTANLKHVIVLYQDQVPVACGAIRAYSETAMEIKRMFVQPDHRRNGFAKMVVEHLERWSKELGYRSCVLETGKNQPEAIQLYQKIGFQIISNYGQYAGIENSVCMQKNTGA
jgi:GNAT superfamily N-acetyltransferase